MPRGPQREQAGSEGRPAHTQCPVSGALAGLARNAPEPEILFSPPLWPRDVLEPIQLPQPFAKHVSQGPAIFTILRWAPRRCGAQRPSCPPGADALLGQGTCPFASRPCAENQR